MAQHKTLGNTEPEKDKLEVGLADDTSSKEFDSDELAKGIKIEKEHTKDEDLAEEIAKDHLKEIPDYYTRLQKMEDEAKAELLEEGGEEDSEEDGEDIPESTEDVFLLLTLAASRNCKAQLNIPTDEEGRVIAQQLGLIYNGLQETRSPQSAQSAVYTFTEPTTGSSFLALNLDDAYERALKVIERFDIQASKLNLTKKAIDWPWGKSETPEEQVDETVEPTTRIEPPKFLTRRSPGITGEPAEATPEQAELIQGLAASKTHVNQLQIEVKQLQDELNQKIAPIQAQIGVEGQNQLRATKQLVAMMAELEQELVQVDNQIGYYSEQAIAKKLTPSEKVKILLERFGAKAEQAIAEAQKNMDEIEQIIVGKYKQWPTKTSAIEGIDEQYLATLYQNMFNGIAGLLSDVQELNLALVA